jgi:alpha 1,3-glucosidase
MNSEVEAQNRRMTVIIDPHIKKDVSYPVYADGIALYSNSTQANVTNTFVTNPDNSIFTGWCWPGNSVWVDFLNENA